MHGYDINRCGVGADFDQFVCQAAKTAASASRFSGLLRTILVCRLQTFYRCNEDPDPLSRLGLAR